MLDSKLQKLEDNGFYKYIFEQSPIAFLILNNEKSICNINNAFIQKFGWNREELINNDIASIVPENKQLIFDEIFNKINKNKYYGPIEINVLRKDRTIVSVFANIKDISSSDGCHFLLSLDDISELKSTQYLLKESQDLWKFALEGSGDGIWDWNLKTNKVYRSDRWKQMLGYEPAEIDDSLDTLMKLVHPDDYSKVNIEAVKNFRGKDSFMCDQYRILCKDGTYKWILDRGKVVETDEYDNPIRIIGTQTDITESKKIEDEIILLNIELESRVKERTARLEQSLESLNNEIAIREQIEEELIKAKLQMTNAFNREKELKELKSRFITMISHEYRTPLTVIMTSTFLLEKYFVLQDEELFSNKIEMIQSSVQAMANLLENVLMLEESEGSKTLVKYLPFNLKKLIKLVVNEVEIYDKYNHKIIIKNVIDDFQFLSDEKLVSYILKNILLNSVTYSPAGTEILIEVFDLEKKLEIRITDYGKGINSTEINTMLEPFTRGDDNQNKSGFGLGLSIVKLCVDILKGNLNVESELEKGTSVFVSLPNSK